MLVYISCKYGTFHICWAITVYRSQSNQYLMNSNQPCSRHEDSFKSAPRLWMSFGACFKAGYKRVWQCVLSRFCTALPGYLCLLCMMRRQPPEESKATSSVCCWLFMQLTGLHSYWHSYSSWPHLKQHLEGTIISHQDNTTVKSWQYTLCNDMIYIILGHVQFSGFQWCFM